MGVLLLRFCIPLEMTYLENDLTSAKIPWSDSVLAIRMGSDIEVGTSKQYDH